MEMLYKAEFAKDRPLTIDILYLLPLMLYICLRWFFEGIFGGIEIELLLLGLGIVFLMITGGAKRKINNPIWAVYCIPIILSVIAQRQTLRVFAQALIVIILVCYQLFAKNDVSLYRFCVSIILFAGIINAAFIIIQTLFGATFNTWYFRYLSDSAKDLALYYYNRGNYFGFNYYPTDAAVLIVSSIAILLLNGIVKHKAGIHRILLLIFLYIALFLTGKKAILLFGTLSLMIIWLLYIKSRKGIIQFFFILILSISAILFIRTQALQHPESQIFYRLNLFLVRLSQGEGYDSGRFRLISEALELWRENRLFGIGWRRFSSYTINMFGHSRAHEVNSDYVQFLCETGIVGFLFMITPIALSLRRAAKALTRCIQEETETELIFYILFACFIQLFIVSYALLEVPFYDMPVFGIYIISCCIINSYYYNTESSEGSRIISLGVRD